jgi:hypothetical protein
LEEVTDQLKTQPKSLVLLEVTSKNLDATLVWLAAATKRERHVSAVALLDYNWSADPDIVSAALREAGATDVICSPRQIRPILLLGKRHALRCNFNPSRHIAADQSIEDWAWSQLPWQDAGRPVR